MRVLLRIYLAIYKGAILSYGYGNYRLLDWVPSKALEQSRGILGW